MKSIRLIVLLLGVALLAACGGSGTATDNPSDQIEQEAPAAEEPAAEAESESASGASAGPATLTLTDMSSFNNYPGDYNLSMVFNLKGTDSSGQPVDSTLTIEGAFQKDPFATTVDMSVTPVGDLGGANNITYAESEGTLYFYNPAFGCAVLPSSEDAPYTDFVDTGGILAGDVQRIQPDETVNDIPSYVYNITNDNLDPTDPNFEEVREITGGKLYIAKDGGYVTRLFLEGVGVSSVLTSQETIEGDVTYQLDFIPAPNGVTVTLPEECAQQQSEEPPYPMMDDASQITSFAGYFQYATSYDYETVAAFYKSEMPSQGWTLGEEYLAGSADFLTFTMGDQTLNVIISFDPATPGAMVNITAQ